MSKYRRAAKVDANQADIVKGLRAIVGVSVALQHDDILVGYKGKTYWFEIKNENAISKKTGLVKDSKVQESQKELRVTWKGHYSIVSQLDEILYDIGILK